MTDSVLVVLAAASLATATAVAAAPLAALERFELRFANEGVALAGTLLQPPGDSLPAVMLIQGSGQSGRDNRWAMSVAEALAGCGVAVLIPDKRGSGESGGDWRTAGFEELAADARAGFEQLRTRPGIDPSRIGYFGLSQGGHVAPLAAARTPGAAFAVNMAGSVQVMEQQLYDELEFAYREHGIDDATIAWLQEFARMSFDYLRTGRGFERYLARHREISAGPLAKAAETWPTSEDDAYWEFWRKVHDFDPVPWWRQLAARGIPALFIYGAEDHNVNVAASADRIASGISAHGSTLRIYQGTGHSLRDESGRLRSDMIADTCKWLHAVPRRPRPGE
ncbi:MAG TPA: alpha/beta fold hydrolase [Steroidobacteraceae bacterium]|nr:alpha/beta fold hydrolase [Steroidobacteraceae bacterium]